MKRKGQNKKELIKNTSLFSACNTKEVSAIASLADEVDVPAGYELAHEGRIGREFFVIADGEAKVSRGGRKVVTLGPGSFFGEMALLDQGPRTATVTAQTPMRLFVLDSRSFSSLIEAAPPVARKMLRALAQRLRTAEKAPTY